MAGRVRRALTRETVPDTGSGFAIGSLRTRVVLIEGDGTQVIDEQAVEVVVDPGSVALPAEVARLRNEVLEQQRHLAAAGRQAHRNGPTYAVSGFSVQRLGVDESPGVRLRVKCTDYFTFLAARQLDRELPDGGTLRGKYVTPFRSKAVGAFPGLWDASAQ